MFAYGLPTVATRLASVADDRMDYVGLSSEPWGTESST